jgi:hypothetical protein
LSNYGKNIEFRVVPVSENRGGRFATQSVADYATTIPQGAPVKVVGEDDLLRATVELADDATPPVKGRCGLAIYEHGDGATWAGVDPYLTTYSDLDTLPAAKAIQVVTGPNVKVVLRNTSDSTFLQSRSYTGRTMVDGLGGATPTVEAGEYLEPHDDPSDTNGYWKVTATVANAWLVVTSVDNDRDECEAQFLF